MCPAHRDLPTPSHPHSRLNLPHPIPSHTYNGLKTFSLSTTPSGRSPPSAQPFVPSTVAYRHKSTKLPSSTTKNSLKKAQGCAEGRGLVPLCGFLTFQCDLPSAGFRSPCGIQQGAAIYAVIRPEFRNLCGHPAGASAAHAVIISPYKI